MKSGDVFTINKRTYVVDSQVDENNVKCYLLDHHVAYLSPADVEKAIKEMKE
jgi:hypothetical protein